jgi:hypothetical protein
MILLLSNPEDIHTNLVLRAIRRKKASVIRVHTSEFPQCANLTYENGTVRFLHSQTNRSFAIDEIWAVWNRRPKPPTIDPRVDDPSDRAFCLEESKHFLDNWFQLMEQAYWVNPIMANQRARYKLFQYAVAARCGIPVPSTIVTNSPQEAKQFFMVLMYDPETQTISVSDEELKAMAACENTLTFTPGSDNDFDD